MSIDYGRKRCGIAVTDPMRIVATALTTVPTAKLTEFVKTYLQRETVDRIVVGYPQTLQGQPSESMRYITPGINALRKALPETEIVFFDERFTSAIAHQSMIASGMKKSQRQSKEAVDSMAATIILNDYLQSRQYNQPI